MSKIVLMRHAKAKKNVLNKHGGKGTSILDKSKEDIKKTMENLLVFYSPSVIFSSPRPQCVETAKFIQDNYSLIFKTSDLLTPISLGVLDGLSIDEASDYFPEYAKQMDDWRNGKIEINELTIQGMENPFDFYNKGLRFINTLEGSNQSNCLVIGTRSILVMMGNLLAGRSPKKGDGYKEIPWKNCGYMTFSIKKSMNGKLKYSLINSESTVLPFI